MTAYSTYRALSFDGGGVRGVFQAQFVATLADLNLITRTQLLAGTSTGAILAVSLATNRDPSNVVKLYRTLGQKIFCEKRWAINRHCFGATSYSSELLKQTLVDEFGSKTTFGSCVKPVLVAATRLNDRSVRVFDSTSESDKDLSIVDVLLASTAAPTYFSPHRISNDNVTYLDGGLVCNNPSFECVTKLWKRCGNLHDIKVLSVANGKPPPTSDPRAFASMRPVSWGLTLVPFNMELSSDFAHRRCAEMLSQGNYCRVDPKLTRDIGLDDYEGAEALLLPLAATVARDSKAEIEAWLRF